jgi:hypothetical protein
LGEFAPNTSVYPANSHSTNYSTISMLSASLNNQLRKKKQLQNERKEPFSWKSVSQVSWGVVEVRGVGMLHETSIIAKISSM